MKVLNFSTEPTMVYCILCDVLLKWVFSNNKKRIPSYLSKVEIIDMRNYYLDGIRNNILFRVHYLPPKILYFLKTMVGHEHFSHGWILNRLFYHIYHYAALLFILRLTKSTLKKISSITRNYIRICYMSSIKQTTQKNIFRSTLRAHTKLLPKDKHIDLFNAS